jgi:hypothetical protein
MHTIEPYYNWRDYYVSEEDERSPFFGREYSEFQYSTKIYDHYIHPQWDYIGSPTLMAKIIYADYDAGTAIIELIGEWNDCINNDIMYLKRDVADVLQNYGINKFILIGENVLNFHESDDSYYEEWFEEVNDTDGWIALLNFRDHVLQSYIDADIDSYFLVGGKLNDLEWRTLRPERLIDKVEEKVQRRLGIIS